MSGLYKATHYVTDDEPCMNLAEVNLVSPHDGKWHRYEILMVIREDELAEYRRDMGLRSKFKHKEKPDGLRIVGGFYDPFTHERCIEETVGRLRDMAFQIREAPAFDKQDLPELSEWQDKKKKIIFN